MKIRNVLTPLILGCQFLTSYGITSLIISGATPLHKAVENRDVEEIRKLINSGANVNAKEDSGYTPLHIAAYFGDIEVIRELLKVPNILVNSQDLLGHTPLHMAILHPKNAAALRELLMVPTIDINITNNDGKTPLQLAQEFNANLGHGEYNPIIALFNAYNQAKQQAYDQAFALLLARHPRLGKTSTAAQLTEDEFRRIKKQLEQLLIQEALSAITI